MSFLYDERGQRKYLTVEERNAFLDAAREAAPEIYTFCATLAYTGGRISEVLSLVPQRIDTDVNVIIIESMKKRRRGVYRAIPLPEVLMKELVSTHNLKSVRVGNQIQ